MGSMLDKKKVLQDQGKNKYGFIVAAIFLVWLFWPQNNSFIRLSYWSYNFFYNASKLFHIEMSTESMHYRNNAVYLAKIYPKNSELSLKAMQKAISLLPENASTVEIDKLYKERAIIKMFYGDKKGALEDYDEVSMLEPIDNLRIAILLADTEQYNDAISYCKGIITKDNTIDVNRYVCTAYVYEKTGNDAAALRIYDWVIGTYPRNAALYIERANLKKRTGNEQGYIEDINAAKKISPDIVPEEASIIDNAVNFKGVPLSVK